MLPLVFLAPLPLSVAHLQRCRSTRTQSSFPVNSIDIERQLGQRAIRAKGKRWCGWCCKKVNEHMHQRALDIHLRSVLSFMFELSLNFLVLLCSLCSHLLTPYVHSPRSQRDINMCINQPITKKRARKRCCHLSFWHCLSSVKGHIEQCRSLAICIVPLNKEETNTLHYMSTC